MFDLKNTRVLVVGGSSGIGEGIAIACAAGGAKVMIASRSEEKLDAAAARIGHEVQTRMVDTREDSSVENFFAKEGVFDHVVMSAAQVVIKPMKDFSVAEAQASMNSKFWGTYRVARAAQIAPSGSLTMISGSAATRATKGRALQTAINAAVEALTKGLALEFAPVRVNTVSPGIIETAAWPQRNDDARRQQLLAMVARNTIARAGQPVEIAMQVIACMTNGFMTGSVINVEGGYLL